MAARKYLSLLILMLFVVSCNLPTKTQSAEATELPVNVTITALFKTAMAVPASRTPEPEAATATRAVATSTKAPAAPTLTQPPAEPTAVPPSATPKVPTAVVIPPVEVVFMSKAPLIDGDWSEWKKVAREYPAQNAVFGAGNRSSEDDLNASYYVGWDATYLYIAVKVRDDRYVQLATGENIYKGDSIELLLDTNRAADLGNHALSSDDYQIGIAPGRPSIADHNPEVYRWFPAGKAGSLSDVVVGVVDEGAVYRVEAAIPWSVFGVTPAKGMRLGFAISVSDNDLTGEQVQQSMVSSVTNRHLTDPATWGELLLK